MSWAIVASVAGAVITGAMNSSASGDAAEAGTEATREGIGEQRRQYNTTRADFAPWRNAGTAAVNRLAVLLGLQRNAGGGTLPASRTRDSLYQEALQRAPMIDSEEGGQWVTAGQSEFDAGGGGSGGRQIFVPGPSRARDLAWANREADRLFAAQNAAGANTGAADDGYGELTRRFTLADRDADPVYQAGLEFGEREGRDAINARAIRAGGYDSGATLRALTRFGNDYGTTRTGESRNRFVSDQDSIYNRLAGVAGTGQTATAQTATAGTNSTNAVTDLITQGGNARAAGIVGGANAWGGASSGITNAANNYTSNQLLQRLLGNRNNNSFSTVGTGGNYGEDWSQ